MFSLLCTVCAPVHAFPCSPKHDKFYRNESRPRHRSNRFLRGTFAVRLSSGRQDHTYVIPACYSVRLDLSDRSWRRPRDCTPNAGRFDQPDHTRVRIRGADAPTKPTRSLPGRVRTFRRSATVRRVRFVATVDSYERHVQRSVETSCCCLETVGNPRPALLSSRATRTRRFSIDRCPFVTHDGYLRNAFLIFNGNPMNDRLAMATHVVTPSSGVAIALFYVIVAL